MGELRPIISAFAQGEDIEVFIGPGTWKDFPIKYPIEFDLPSSHYRIKQQNLDYLPCFFYIRRKGFSYCFNPVEIGKEHIVFFEDNYKKTFKINDLVSYEYSEDRKTWHPFK